MAELCIIHIFKRFGSLIPIHFKDMLFVHALYIVCSIREDCKTVFTKIILHQSLSQDFLLKI